MKIFYKVGSEIIGVDVCDLCGYYKKPKGGKKMITQSSLPPTGSVPIYYLCSKCGKDKFYDNTKDK